jgi:hypothetical protein
VIDEGERVKFSKEELAKRTFNVRVRRRQLKGLLKEEDIPAKKPKKKA